MRRYVFMNFEAKYGMETYVPVQHFVFNSKIPLCKINFILNKIWYNVFVGGAVYSPAITDFTFMVKVCSNDVTGPSLGVLT